MNLMGQMACELAQSGHTQAWNIACGGHEAIAVFPDQRSRAAPRRVGEIAPSIGTLPGPGGERARRARLARIGGDVLHRHALGAQVFEDRQGLRRAHMFSLPTAPAAASSAVRRASWSGVSGTSGATPSVRKVPSVMRENTGAATVPPKYWPALGSSIMTATTMRGLVAGAKPTNDDTYLRA